MSENIKLWRWGIWFRIPFIGDINTFWTGMNMWAFSVGRCDYGTVVIAIPGFWFSWSDPGLWDHLDEGA
jgi:hypothetical protein